jgi:hypothetical protein
VNLFDIYIVYIAIAVPFHHFLRENDEGRGLSLFLAATAPLSIPIICLHALWRIHSLCSPVLPEARVVSEGERTNG